MSLSRRSYSIDKSPSSSNAASPISQRKDMNRSESLRVVSNHTHRIFRPSDLIHGEVLGKGCFGQAIKVAFPPFYTTDVNLCVEKWLTLFNYFFKKIMLHLSSSIDATTKTIEICYCRCWKFCCNNAWMINNLVRVSVCGTGDSQGDGGGDGHEGANSLRWRDTKDVLERGERELKNPRVKWSESN